ncbi:MAG: hypothetical protein KDA51_02455, partial [Planctomycetales bacterium]|nr:hypothetical protein [Planctomycetales bacterium]
DLMIAGAVSSRVAPTRLIYRPRDLYDHHPLDSSENEPRCVPFDARRRGILASEGSAAIVLERRRHAVRRGAPILATVLAAASRCAEPSRPYGGSRQSIAAAASAALDEAAVDVADLAHISAQGFSETYLDIEEAAAITKFGPTCPVTAFSSYFGTAGSACGMLELVASILSVHGRVSLPTLGYQVHDPDCDIRITTQQRATSQDHFLKLSFTPMGHAAAVVIRCAN